MKDYKKNKSNKHLTSVLYQIWNKIKKILLLFILLIFIYFLVMKCFIIVGRSFYQIQYDTRVLFLQKNQSQTIVDALVGVYYVDTGNVVTMKDDILDLDECFSQYSDNKENFSFCVQAKTGQIFDQVYYFNKVSNQSESLKDLIKYLIKTNWNNKKYRNSLLKQFFFINEASIIELQNYDRADLASFNQSLSQCSISLVNTTEITGLAGFTASLFETSGLYVVKITGDNQNLEKSKLILLQDQIACKPVVDKLTKFVGSNIELDYNENITQQYRSTAVFFIGKDLGERYSQVN